MKPVSHFERIALLTHRGSPAPSSDTELLRADREVRRRVLHRLRVGAPLGVGLVSSCCGYKTQLHGTPRAWRRFEKGACEYGGKHYLSQIWQALRHPKAPDSCFSSEDPEAHVKRLARDRVCAIYGLQPPESQIGELVMHGSSFSLAPTSLQSGRVCPIR